MERPPRANGLRPLNPCVPCNPRTSSALSDPSGIVVSIEDRGKRVRITTDIPASYFSAITALKWKSGLKQGEIVTEALRLYFEKEAGL